MPDHIFPKTDNKGIGGAIVGSVGQVVDAYKISPANQDTTTNPAPPPPAGDPPSVSPGSSPDSESANPPLAFRPKGRMDLHPTAGPKSGVKGTVKSTATKPK